MFEPMAEAGGARSAMKRARRGAGLAGAKPAHYIVVSVESLLAVVVKSTQTQPIVFVTLTTLRVYVCVGRGEVACESECEQRQKEDLTHGSLLIFRGSVQPRQPPYGVHCE